MELAGHKDVAAATGMNVYFADPHAPWQRGTNENTNRWLRQYFPKKTTMNGQSQADLDQIAQKLNNRPPKILGYDTLAERFEALLHRRFESKLTFRSRRKRADGLRVSLCQARARKGMREPPPSL